MSGAVGDRRAALRWTVAAALAPVLATRGVAAAVRGARFAPPGGAMTFTRRLERGLSGGVSLVVERSFAVAFEAAPGGWTLSGNQVAVSVDAPERIAQLAALERGRKETGLFPLSLDRTGTIVGGPEARQAAELDEALAIVRRGLASGSVSPDGREQLEAFVRAVHAAGARMASLLPSDLFAPREADTRSQRQLGLPGGEAGTIEVRFHAATDPATGLMRRARREIVTAFAGDRRTTREDWTLIPA